MDFLTQEALLDKGTLRFRSMYIPDIWIEAGTQPEQYNIAGLSEDHIIDKVASVVDTMRDYR